MTAMRNWMLALKTNDTRTGVPGSRTISNEIRRRALEWYNFITDGVPLTTQGYVPSTHTTTCFHTYYHVVFTEFSP